MAPKLVKPLSPRPRTRLALLLVTAVLLAPTLAAAEPAATLPAVAPASSTAPAAVPAASTARPSAASLAQIAAAGAGECSGPGNLLTRAKLLAVGTVGAQIRVHDGALAREGSLWNAPSTVQLRDTHSALVYDLGTPQLLRALVAQGDNNDEYTIETSIDATKYELAWTVPEVTIGQGLRTRTVVLPKPVLARYLRLQPKRGDNYYSISEVQAFCDLTKNFPPKLSYPPVKYGWDALDNENMVLIKGITAAFAAALFALAWWRRAREWRVQNLAVRVLVPSLFFVAAVGCVVLARAAASNDSGALATFAKLRCSVPGLYYSAGILFLCGLGLFGLCVRRGGPRPYELVLAVLGVLSVTGWWNLGHYHFDHYIHTWEHYHYILGAKYGPELRYSRLYQCTAVADTEDGLRTRVKARKMRRLESDNELGTTDEILANPALCKSHFKTPERWEQFRKDMRFFRSKFGRERWDQSQTDHGYNATPVWAITGRLLADRVELTWDNIVKVGIIDSVYLLIMWLVVWWAFGWQSATVAALYWGTNFPARFYWNGGSFLRYDWMLWMVVGLCFLRKRHMALGGAALTYATLLRVFPGFIVATLVLKALANMVRERRIFLTREHTRFAAGCIVTMAVLIPASSWSTGGLDAWGEFARNSKKHLSTALTNNVGFKTVMGYEFDTRAQMMRDDKAEDAFRGWKDSKQYFYAKRAPFMYGALLLFLIMLARAAEREEDWVAACLGAGLIFMASELSCYYMGFLLPYGLMWEKRRLPGVLLAAYSAATCFLYRAIPWNDDHFAAMSVAAVVIIIAATAHVAYGKRLPNLEP